MSEQEQIEHEQIERDRQREKKRRDDERRIGRVLGDALIHNDMVKAEIDGCQVQCRVRAISGDGRSATVTLELALSRRGA